MSNPLYQPISSERGEIRLLEILLACDEAVGCDLIHVSLDDNPVFSALSYVWGDPKDVEPINISSQTVYVTRSLGSALRHVKKHWRNEFAEREPSTFRLWADAVCINQEDAKERSEQVPLMARIYSMSEAVFTFIRHSEANVLPLAMDTFEEINNTLVTRRDGFGSRNANSTFRELLSEDTPAPHGRLGSERWYAIEEFARLPNWDRVWIAQELILATRVIFFTDSRCISYEVVSKAFGFLSKLRRYLMDPSNPLLISSGLYHAIVGCMPNALIGFQATKRLMAQTNSKPNWTISYMASKLRATDPRDYICGLLGLTRLPIQPDYEKSLSQTYQEYVSTWLKSESNLNNLEDIQELFFLKWAGRGFHQDHEDLPSWVPRYDIKKMESLTTLEPQHNAGFGVDRGAFTSNGLLCVGGIQVAPTVAVSKPVIDPHSLLTAVRDFVNHSPAAHTVSGIPRLQAIHRLITGDTCYDSSQSTEVQIGRAFVFVLCLTRTALSVEGGTRISHLLSLGLEGDYDGDNSGKACFRKAFADTFFASPDIDFSIMDGFSSDEWETPYILQFQEQLTNIYNLWKFAEMAGPFGNRLALVPRYAAVGDVACVIRGTGWPVLLRPDGDEWVFIGRCFVLGAMKGEALEQVKSRRADIEHFRIK